MLAIAALNHEPPPRHPSPNTTRFYSASLPPPHSPSGPPTLVLDPIQPHAKPQWCYFPARTELYSLAEAMEAIGVEFPYQIEALTDEYPMEEFFNATTFREALYEFATTFFASYIFSGTVTRNQGARHTHSARRSHAASFHRPMPLAARDGCATPPMAHRTPAHSPSCLTPLHPP